MQYSINTSSYEEMMSYIETLDRAPSEESITKALKLYEKDRVQYSEHMNDEVLVKICSGDVFYTYEKNRKRRKKTCLLCNKEIFDEGKTFQNHCVNVHSKKDNMRIKNVSLFLLLCYK